MNPLRDLETTVFQKVNPLVRFSVSRYVLAIGLFVAVVAFGLISTLTLGVDQFPHLNVPVVAVTTAFPGATPSVVDQQITKVIENIVSSVKGVTDIESSSSTGASQLIIFFDQNSDQNIDANQVATKVSAAAHLLPLGAEPPTVQTYNPNNFPILQFGISGDGANLADVGDYVSNELAPALTSIPGVANIRVDGAPSRTFRVLLDPNKLQGYDLAPQQVTNAIRASAINRPIGTFDSHNNSLTFATQNMPEDVGQIGRTVVDPARGIAVIDVGVVRDLPVSGSYARVNGTPVVLVSVLQAPDSNAVSVVDNVKKALQRAKLPAGYGIAFSNDTTKPIRASTASTFRELAITAVVVAFIVLLFLGKLDTAFAVILAIPIALSAAPVLYNLFGFTFNLVSLLALITAIGIVVDDSVVVAENVERYRAMGFSLKESVFKGASEVFSAVVAATLSLLAVLLPLSFLGGIIGQYIRQFSLGLAAAVAFSLLEALLFLTVRLAYGAGSARTDWKGAGKSVRQRPDMRSWRKPIWAVVGAALLILLAVTKHFLWLPVMLAYPFAVAALGYAVRVVYSFFSALTATLHGWTEVVLERIREAYVRSLNGLLRRSAVLLIASLIGMGALAWLLFPKIAFSFLPPSDSGTLTINLTLPAGTPAIVTNRETLKLENFLMKRPEVAITQTVVGSSGVLSAGVIQPEKATLNIQLVPASERASVFQLMADYRTALLALSDGSSAQLALIVGGGFQGQGSALRIRIVSPDERILAARDGQLLQAFRKNQYVASVSSSRSSVTLENDFSPDPGRMKGTGIDPSSVASALQTYTSGVQASTVWVGGNSYPLQVQINPIYLTNAESLLNLPIYSPMLRTNLQVGQLGTFAIRQAPVVITRFNRLYSTEYTFDLTRDAPTQSTVQTMVSQELGRQKGLLGNGAEISPGASFGENAVTRQLATTVPNAFLLAFFLVYLVMAAQFNSWRYPIYLLLPVPLAVIGALLLLVPFGGTLDVFGVLGMLLLIGLSAKNAILYLDFVVERIKRMPMKEALLESARLRFRPIVMTTLTVLVISGPLVFSIGEGSEFGQRLGLVMFGGIIFSAVLTFFIVPAAFFLFERKRQDAQKNDAAEGAAR